MPAHGPGLRRPLGLGLLAGPRPCRPPRFYLQAPTHIAHPDARHWNVSIGHAVSRDLVRWDVRPDALCPGPAGAWDDASTWTGSVVAHDGGWAMLYTGSSRAEAGRIQRIGLATSADLNSWVKHDGPVLEADPRWYEIYDAGDPAERGVIGHARSADLRRWEALAPVTEPGAGFGQMEVPQLVEHGGRCYLLFCSDTETQAPRRRSTGAGTGTYYLMGDAPLGPFSGLPDHVLEADRQGSTYAGKLHETTRGELVFLAWHRTRADGSFHGALSDPRPVVVEPDGRLSLR